MKFLIFHKYSCKRQQPKSLSSQYKPMASHPKTKWIDGSKSATDEHSSEFKKVEFPIPLTLKWLWEQEKMKDGFPDRPLR
jgi:hypothetical protein